MIYKISSSLPTFKGLDFHPGLNILLAQKKVESSEKQTRNRAGKTSLIEIVHFLAGANADKDSLFRSEPILSESFEMTFDLGREVISVERSGQEKSKIRVAGATFLNGEASLSNTEWISLLGEQMFDLQKIPDTNGRIPTFRSLFSYFVRRQHGGAFTKPEKQANMQQAGDYQVALLYLLGLDWMIASDWQKVRDREKTLKELRKAALDGAFGNVIGKAAELRTELTISESSLQQLRNQLLSFKVLPQYKELEREADQMTHSINQLANANVIDAALIRDLENAIKAEAPPPLDDLERLYADAGIVLPGVAIKRYAEVQSFHQSVVRNRRDYLSSELEAAKQRVQERDIEKARRDTRRSEIMSTLSSHGALEQFSALQARAGRKEAEVESLRQRFYAAEQLEGTKNELEIERNRLEIRLRRDLTEQEKLLSEAILEFEKVSKRLYESAGSMSIDATSNGPDFQFKIQGARSKGISNMQIFCFDMMLMCLTTKRGYGPGFLIHDSHLFDGVDGRQVGSALKAGAELAEEIGFQYIVTMNEDDAFKEKTDGFQLEDYVLPVVLTDDKEDGGLFGLRF